MALHRSSKSICQLNERICLFKLSCVFPSLLGSLCSFLWTGIPHKVVVSNETRHVKTLNEVKELYYDYHHHYHYPRHFPFWHWFHYWSLGLWGELPVRNSFSFLLCNRHLAVLVHTPDSRCHNYLSSSCWHKYHSWFLPASIFLVKTILCIWKRKEKKIKTTKILNHKISELEDFWTVT